MKIVSRAEFLKLPAGTLYAKYRPCVFEALCIKGESLENDWRYQPIVDAIEFADSDQYLNALEQARMTGASLSMDFYCETRDGCFEADQLFSVWETEDRQALIARLLCIYLERLSITRQR